MFLTVEFDSKIQTIAEENLMDPALSDAHQLGSRVVDAVRCARHVAHDDAGIAKLQTHAFGRLIRGLKP